jgi:hypothetical protein
MIWNPKKEDIELYLRQWNLVIFCAAYNVQFSLLCYCFYTSPSSVELNKPTELSSSVIDFILCTSQLKESNSVELNEYTAVPDH